MNVRILTQSGSEYVIIGKIGRIGVAKILRKSTIKVVGSAAPNPAVQTPDAWVAVEPNPQLAHRPEVGRPLVVICHHPDKSQSQHRSTPVTSITDLTAEEIAQFSKEAKG